uniref:Uncharacterized protein n=1 Tax=Lotharella globosa TaxID=91324 RepID=A0A7S3Z769_9EUKA
MGCGASTVPQPPIEATGLPRRSLPLADSPDQSKPTLQDLPEMVAQPDSKRGSRPTKFRHQSVVKEMNRKTVLLAEILMGGGTRIQRSKSAPDINLAVATKEKKNTEKQQEDEHEADFDRMSSLSRFATGVASTAPFPRSETKFGHA